MWVSVGKLSTHLYTYPILMLAWEYSPPSTPYRMTYPITVPGTPDGAVHLIRIEVEFIVSVIIEVGGVAAKGGCR